jgi:hypothetical protein
MPQTLAQMVRAKFPGAYDDMDDAALESSVRKKFPGAYDDIPPSPAASAPEPPAAAPRGWPATIGDAVLDVGKGALKGLGSTVSHIGELAVNAGMIPGQMPAAFSPEFRSPVFRKADELTTPTNAAQTVGKVGEQIAEVVLPGKAISSATQGLGLAGRMGAEAIAGAGMSAAQGGNPIVGAVGGAALPAIGAGISAAVPALKGQAAKQVVEALGPTKERFKAMAERLTPEILQRGLRGSREQLQAHAADAAEAAGAAVDDAIQLYGSRQADTKPVLAALESAKDAFRTSGPHGNVVEIEPRAIRQLDGLQKVVTELGPTPPVEKLVAVRRAWDSVVEQAGGYAHRAGGAIGMPLKDVSEAKAKREGATAIRKLLDAEVPELSALNKEFSFWKSLDGVLTQTMKRTQPQGPGLVRQGAETAGAVVGGLAGSTHGPAGAVGGAVALAKLSKMATSVFSSPRWKLASAQAKDSLADAIMANDLGKISTALGRIGAVQGSKIGQ